MSKVRFVLVGAGRAGMVHANNLVHYIPEGELQAIVDLDLERARERAEELGVKHFYQTIDQALMEEEFEAVAIGSLTFTHREIVEKAAQAGKHVFCEKPLAQTVEEAQKMVEVVEKSGIKFQIGFMRRYDPAIRKAWDMIQAGEIGDLVVVKSTGRGPGLPPPWIWDRKKSGGMLAEVSTHDVDAVLWTVGKCPERVYMEAKNFKAPEAKKDFPDFYDHYLVTLNFQDGPIGTIDGGCPVGYAYDARMEFLGTKGMIQVGQVEGNGPTLMTLDKTAIRDNHASWRYRFKEGYLEEMKSFIRCILKDEQPSPSVQDGYRAAQVVEAAHRSLDQGQAVVFPWKW
ncbi:MAG: myo-inositol 2-dehydrogenase / D-chiro-inositol 1-dehydrogenase [Candidatus Atribacteria bacterium]|nr:myo-inositol 2-dehydrogenase / D-chiro-inositol 1-dehydrogenase [Candidatus Atribacteria bacterium]